MKELIIPLTEQDIQQMFIGDQFVLSGAIFCGRDAVLPKLSKMSKDEVWEKFHIDLEGSVIFHTAVSPAGIGPTSSNKLEIESSIIPLSKLGVKLHLGKGSLKQETVKGLNEEGAVFAVIPPVTALLKSKTLDQQIVAFPEEGMEALHLLHVDQIPIVIAAAHGNSIFN